MQSARQPEGASHDFTSESRRSPPFDEIQLWKDFFTRLGIRTISSENYRDGVSDGKRISGSEFCAPMSEMHACTQAFPKGRLYLSSGISGTEGGDAGARRGYCYYTQYAAPVINACGSIPYREKILSPVIRSLGGSIST